MSNNTEHIDDITLITKYLAKEASEEEITLLEIWRSADPSNNTLFEEYKKSWESIDNVRELSQLDIDAEWSKLESTIAEDREDEKVIPITQAEKKFDFGRIVKIAAIWLALLLPAGGAYYYFTEYNVERLVAEGKTIEGVLPDGSNITLNSNSVLAYDKDFGKDSRKVQLEGEAYFDVIPDKFKPFIIDAGPVLVEVLGTSFYVSANEDNDEIEVIVESGIVNVCKKSNLLEKIVLEAGNKGVFSKEEQAFTKSENDDENYLSWKTRKLVFKKKRLSNIIKKLNLVYHSNIVIKSKEIKNCRVSGTFNRQTLDEILNVLQATLDIEINKKESSIELSGEGC